MTNKPEILFPLLKGQAADCSVLIAGPDGFDLFRSLENADTLSIAIAFGHWSGWKLIEKAILSANKKSVRILLGQAYFQTEPKLLLHLQREKDKRPFLDVRLANSARTFHPKVWLIDREDRREAIVSSGNLSQGGLAKNVECGFFTKDKAARLQLDAWFTLHWRLASKLSSSIQAYLNGHNKYHQRTASLEMGLAVQAALSYWASPEGLKAVKQRDKAIRTMRCILRYPDFLFNKEEWIKFLQTPEFGGIRLSHIEKNCGLAPSIANRA